MQVSADSNNPSIISFGYNGTDDIDQALSFDIRQKSKSTDLDNFNFDKSHVIYLGGYFYLEKSGNKYCDIYFGNTLNSDYTQLKNSYSTYRSNVKNLNSINRYQNIKKYGVNYNTSANNESNSLAFVKNVANMSSSTTAATSGSLVHMSTMRDFTADNLLAENINVQPFECGPVAGMNIVYYWAQYRGVPIIYNDIHVTRQENDQNNYWWLEEDMGTANHGVPDMNTFVNGLVSFGERDGYAPAGTSNVASPSQSWIKTNIANENIFGFGERDDPTYGGSHLMTGIGWETSGSSFYVRVLNGINATTSEFYNLASGYPTEAGYVRW